MPVRLKSYGQNFAVEISQSEAYCQKLAVKSSRSKNVYILTSEGGVRELLFFFQGNIGEVVDGSLEDSISVSRWQKSSWFSLRLSVRTYEKKNYVSLICKTIFCYFFQRNFHFSNKKN